MLEATLSQQYGRPLRRARPGITTLLSPRVAALDALPYALEQSVMIVHIPDLATPEGYPEPLLEVLSFEREPPLELHLEVSLAIDMHGDEISPFPVVREAQSREAVPLARRPVSQS